MGCLREESEVRKRKGFRQFGEEQTEGPFARKQGMVIAVVWPCPRSWQSACLLIKDHLQLLSSKGLFTFCVCLSVWGSVVPATGAGLQPRELINPDAISWGDGESWMDPPHAYSCVLPLTVLRPAQPQRGAG